MDLNAVNSITKEKIKFSLGELIGKGSNSNIYELYTQSKYADSVIGKISNNNKNYVSFNLQYNSFLLCQSLNNYGVLVPRIYFYGQVDELGEILIMQKLEELYDLSFIINNSLYYGELVIKKVAETLARLHNMGISGYDVEFYWNPQINQLVILDIGPQYTFDINYDEMLNRHFYMEKNNPMGKWNLVSQIIPEDEAKKWFSNIESFDENDLLEYIDPSTVTMHVANVAQIHALSTISKLSQHKQKQYLDIFLKEYKKHRKAMTLNTAEYIKKFSGVVENGYLSAEANLYYSKVKTLCRESCAVHLER